MSLKNVQDIYPLTATQAGMLFHTIEAQAPGMYVIQVQLTLKGSLNREALMAAWDDVVGRHDALRASFVWEDLEEPLQIIHESVNTSWVELNGSQLMAEYGPHAITEWLDGERLTRFDLKKSPLSRLGLISINDETHRFVWTLHHAIADGWSVAVIIDELRTAYHSRIEGRTPELPEPQPFRSLIAWLKNHDVDASESAWRRYLGGFREPSFIVGGDRRSSKHQWNETPRLCEVRLSETACRAIADTARSLRVTQTELFKCAWAAVFSRWTGTQDVVYGTMVSGRAIGLPRIEHAVGLYMNAVPCRIRLESEPTLRRLIQSVHAESLELREHENTPLSRIQEWSQLAPGSPLFDSLLVVENQPLPRPRGGQEKLQFADLEVIDQSNYPISAFVIPDDGLRLLILHHQNAISSDTADRLLAQFTTALEALPLFLDHSPLELPVLPQTELHRLESFARGPHTEMNQTLVHELVSSAAKHNPSGVAIACGDDSITYSDLETRSDALAWRLTEVGAGRGDRIALLLDRGCDVVIAMLASLKSGAAYVPLDPGYPSSWLDRVIDDCRPGFVITSSRFADATLPVAARALRIDDPRLQLSEGPPSEWQAPEVDEKDPAYVLYTSGSTGRPKGVVITHGNLSYSTKARFQVYDTQPGSFLMLSSFAFDSSVAGVYWTLASGGKLLISEAGQERDVDWIAGSIFRHEVTHTLCLPSLYEVILDHAPATLLKSLKVIVVAGESVPQDLVGRHRAFAPQASLFNEYGPTEACVWCTVFDASTIDTGAVVPIGKPIPGTEVRILGADGRPVPVGAPGEIWIAGPGLAHGYLNEPAEDRSAFGCPNSDLGRMYRSGDFARYRPDGSIEFLGRRDQQVKIRGHRIELAEIESVLQRHPAVRDAVAVTVNARADTGKEKQSDRASLAAFVIAADLKSTSDPTELVAYLRSELPGYSVPASVRFVDELPRLPNGKVDRKESTKLWTRDAIVKDESGEPRNEFEGKLSEIWRNELGVDQVSVFDDFFDLGGDSITSIKIVARARQQGIRLSPNDIFEYPTISDLSASRPQPEAEETRETGARVMQSVGSASGRGTPFFMVHGGRRILNQLTQEHNDHREVFLLTDHRDSGDVAPFASIESLADEYIARIRRLSAGPRIFLGGYSIGAPIAVEVARRLQNEGNEPLLLFLLDPSDDPHRFRIVSGFEGVQEQHEPRPPGVADDESDPARQPEQKKSGAAYWTRLAVASAIRSIGFEIPPSLRRTYVPWVYDRALRSHSPEPYDGPTLIFQSQYALKNLAGITLWQHLCRGRTETVEFEASHIQFSRDPSVVSEWTRRLAEYLLSNEIQNENKQEDGELGSGR